MSLNWVAFWMAGRLMARMNREVPRVLAMRLFLKNV